MLSSVLLKTIFEQRKWYQKRVDSALILAVSDWLLPDGEEVCSCLSRCSYLSFLSMWEPSAKCSLLLCAPSEMSWQALQSDWKERMKNLVRKWKSEGYEQKERYWKGLWKSVFVPQQYFNHVWLVMLILRSGFVQVPFLLKKSVWLYWIFRILLQSLMKILMENPNGFLEVNREEFQFALSHCWCHGMGEVTVPQDTQQSCLLARAAVTCSVSFVQLTNTGNIAKEAVAKQLKNFHCISNIWSSCET